MKRVALAVLVATSSASAQSTIRSPGDHPAYALEVEPHLDVGPFAPPSAPFATSAGWGAGVRFSIPIADRAFVRSIDDTVAISFGADLLFYSSGAVPGSTCDHFVPAPNGTQVCVDVAGAAPSPIVLFLPVALQWNFWLTPRWSVFGEPGIVPDVRVDGAPGQSHLGLGPAISVGGRYRFGDALALTMRLGYPTFSVGLSWLR